MLFNAIFLIGGLACFFSEALSINRFCPHRSAEVDFISELLYKLPKKQIQSPAILAS
jgi:hypothetical protein